MAIGRNDYDERKEAHMDRLHNQAVKAHNESQQQYTRANNISRQFEGGQPILVGHHSELNHLFAVDFENNKDLALIVGEMLNRHNPNIYTDMELGSISIIIDSNTEGA